LDVTQSDLCVNGRGDEAVAQLRDILAVALFRKCGSA
jgi:hypothetical protein